MNEWWAAARANPVFRMAIIIAVAIIAVDQASKLWILHWIDLDQGCQRLSDGRLVGCTNRNIELGPVFDLTYVENTGVSFGLFAGGMVSRVLLTILAVVVAGFVVHWAGRLNRRAAAIGAGLIVGGALGNAIDRSFYGFVVDFFDFSGLGFPWVFNVADSAINVGVAFLAYDAFFVAPKSATKADTAETTASLSSDEPGERKAKETFPAKDPASIRPEDQDSRSPE